jgi:NitT/TauT family transport system substrate-binding protein
MQRMKDLGRIVVATAATVLALAPQVAAEDLLKVAVVQRGAWETAAPHLGQQAGIFKKHGIVLELSYADEDTELPVISGDADVEVGVGIMDVLRAYTGKDPSLRIIGANMTGSANYWYVAATSPIKKVKDISFRSIAYSKADQYDMFDFLDRFGLKARPVLTSGEAAAFDQVMAGKIDVGWATPPHGVDALEEDRIHIVAKASEVPKIRDKTGSVMIANADTLHSVATFSPASCRPIAKASAGCIRTQPLPKHTPSSPTCRKGARGGCGMNSSPKKCYRRTRSWV